MLVDMIVDMISTVVLGLVEVVNSAWSVVDVGPVGAAFGWFVRLDRYLPVSELCTMVGIVGMWCGFSILLKATQKVIDWWPGKLS